MRLRPLTGGGVRALREFAQALGIRPFKLALGCSVLVHGVLLFALSGHDLQRAAPPARLLRVRLAGPAASPGAVRRERTEETPIRSRTGSRPRRSAASGFHRPPGAGRFLEGEVLQPVADGRLKSAGPADPGLMAPPPGAGRFPPEPAAESEDQNPAPAAARESAPPPPEEIIASPVGTAGAAAPPEIPADAVPAGPAGPSTGDLAALRRRIDARKVYPQLALRNGWEGRALVEMRLGGDGSLTAVRLLQGSGYAVLDEATLSAVRRAAPFPPVACVVAVPVEFRLVP